MSRMLLLGGLLLVGTVSIVARQAGPPQPPDKLDIDKLKDNLYVIKGSGSVSGGGNTAAFITASGVVVVDTKYVGWGPKIIDAIRTFTDKPITTIINTHTHGDHTGGNPDFPATVEVIAHENTKANMEKMTAFQGDKAKFLPKRTFKDKMTLLGGKDRIDLYYFGAGHTNGDAFIVFPSLRVMHAGDMFATQGTPLIDINNGGSGVAYPKTLKAAAAAIKGVDTIVTGHSPSAMPWSALAEYGEFVQAIVDAVQQGVKEGKSADEITSGLKLPEKFKAYTMTRAAEDVGKIYAELKK